MRKLKEYRGTWFLPDFPDVKLAGVLRISTDKSSIVLTIFSNIKPNGMSFLQDVNDRVIETEIIQGEIDSIERVVTLFGFNGKFFESTVGIDQREYTFKVDFAFFGLHFSSQESIKFPSLSYQIGYFGQWFDSYTRLIKNDSNPFNPKYRGDKLLEIPIKEGVKISLLRTAAAKEAKFDFEIKILHFVEVHFEQAASFWEHNSILHCFMQFLHFAVGEPIEIIRCFSDKFNYQKIVSNSWTDLDPVRDVSWRMPFTASKFSDEDLVERIQNWFKVHNKFSACMSVYEQAVSPIWLSGSKTLTSTQFTNIVLNVSQALEGFFRKDNDIDYQSIKDNFNRTKSTILKKIKNKKESIGLDNDELQFINNYLVPKRTKEECTFQQMILTLCESQKEALSDFLDKDSFHNFTVKLKDLRNTLTHLNHDEHDKVSQGKLIFQLFNVSQALFYSLIMSKIGFTQLEIKAMLENIKGFMENYD